MTGTHGVMRALNRTIQLDAIAYILIAAFMVLASVLGFMVVNSVEPPEGWLLGSEWIQLLGLAFVGATVIYLLDQHRRLRTELAVSHESVATARDRAEMACLHLTAAHRAAEVMTVVTEEDQLQRVVEEIAREHQGFGVAIMGDTLLASSSHDELSDRLLDGLERASASAVNGDRVVTIPVLDGDVWITGFPLRLLGKLGGVLCVWKSEPFTSDEIGGLSLTARVIELGRESRLLYEDVNRQLQGLVTMVTGLIDQRIPGYAEDTGRVVELSESVGVRLHMGPDELRDLRLATQLRDLGMLGETPVANLFEISAEPRATAEHPGIGARMAELVHLSSGVQQAILGHHEDFGGSGYPQGLTGYGIPLAARIIRTCEAFVRLSGSRPTPASNAAAMLLLVKKSGTTFDPAVVGALAGVMESHEPRPLEWGTVPSEARLA